MPKTPSMSFWKAAFCALASSRPAALKQVQTELAFTAVAKAEGILVSDEECEAEYSRLAELYQMEVERVKAAIPAESLKQDLALKKASDLVLEKAQVGEAPQKEDEEKKTKKSAEKQEESGEEKPKRTRKKKAEGSEESEAE